MKRMLWLSALAALVGGACWAAEGTATRRREGTASKPHEGTAAKPDEEGWVSLFDGKSLDGWKASENTGTFKVEDGAIVCDGKRSHLFYVGPVQDHDFRNFEWKVEVKTAPKANSGLYFHTEYQEKGWPAKGYEAQINNTHGDPRKTGSLYAVEDVAKSPVEDEVWFTYHIIVKGKRIVLKVNDQVTVDYTEPGDLNRDKRKGRVLSSGTFALQGHDPGSKVWFRNIRVKPLPDDVK